MIRYVLPLLFIYTALIANHTYYKIMIGSFSKVENAKSEIAYYKKRLPKHKAFKDLRDANHLTFHTYHGKKYHTVSLRPFKNRSEANAILGIIHTYQKSPYLSKYKTKLPIVFATKETEASSSSPMNIEIVEEKLQRIEKAKPQKDTAAKVEPVNVAKQSTEKSSISSSASSAPKEEVTAIAVEEVKKTDINSTEKAQKQVVTPVEEAVLIKTTPELMIQKESKGYPASLVYKMLEFFPYVIILTLIFLLFMQIRINRHLKDENTHLLDETEHSISLAKTQDEFLTKMSHEIRTPMNAIIGFSHILLETKLDANQLTHLSNIQNSADLLLGIINDILSYSRIESGNIKAQKLLFNINSVLDNVSTKMAQNARKKGLQLIFEVANNVPSRIVGDEEKLGDVILNLVSNAIKYTKKGDVIVRMKRLDSSSELIILECKVSDTGIGIKQEALADLFDSFIQADNSHSRQYDGMGLGLAIVQEYVHLMDGEIKVESQYGKGSTFSFTVIFDAPEKIDLRNYRLPDKSIMNKRVLVVDDNTSAAGSLQRMIAYYHYQADIVETEEEAIKILKEHDYDILCLDSSLLDESLADTIQRYKEFSNAKIVLLENDIVKNIETPIKGIDAELQKPFNQQDIFDTIIELYSEARTSENTPMNATKESISQFKGQSILLAEDNKINQSVIKSLLNGTGVTLLIANNGQEAIELLYKNPQIKMIFMDISMPVMNGYDAAKTIRKDAQFVNLPIVALTANILPADVEKSMQSGMQEHIGKPFNVTAFYEAIIKYLSSNKKLKRHATSIPNNITKAEPKTLEEDLVSHAVLDRKSGLELVGGDEQLFQELLDEFVGMYKDSDVHLGEMLNREEYDQGAKLSHDIKGVSANLGLMAVFESVKALEASFKALDSADAKDKLEIFAKQLKEAIAEIEN